MRLATQYYRPPFPRADRWPDDLRLIKQTGLDTIVVSVPWAWAEPEPGELELDDIDDVLAAAGSVGLDVIVCFFAEIQPVWIHREVPDSHMVDHRGQAVVSSALSYTQFGIMPGGCTDHPQVRELMGRFLTRTARRYASADNLVAWDCWNEIRWPTQADGYVCHCAHTTALFHEWLRERFGTLDALNDAWQRRYRRFEDIAMAKVPPRTYTDVIAYQAFLTRRAAVDLRWRHDAVRAGDPARPIYAHTAFPAIHCTGEFLEFEPALARGNDWELAQVVDGFGSSHFPSWIHTDPVDYAARLEASRCATGDKTYWVAELQGGAAGHGLQAMRPVPGAQQARWVWNGVARGAKAVSFWCWRDEVFGRESGGFGIVGDDGHRDDRLTELRAVATAFRQHEQLLDDYAPEPARVGVVFEPSAYHLDWAATVGGGLTATGVDPYAAGHDLNGYLRALERTQIPYDVVEPRHCPDLSRYRLMILPWALVVDGAFGSRLVDWVRAGGTLLVEPELDAFDTAGLYRYPDERPLARALGLQGAGRRQLDERRIEFSIGDDKGELDVAGWLEPQADGALLTERPLGAGRVVAIGTFAGLAYWTRRHDGFETFVHALAGSAAARPDLRCDFPDGSVVQWRFGRSADHGLLFVLNEGPERATTFRAPAGHLPYRSGTDLLTGADLAVRRDRDEDAIDIRLAAGGRHVVDLRP